MPVALALPDLGLVLAAVFLLLIAAALWVLANLLQQSLGRVPVIGSWIVLNIVAVLNDARLAVIRAAAAAFDAAVDILNWLQSWLWRMFIGLVLWVAQAATTINHIATVQVPALESRVEATVLGWVDSAVAAASAALAASISAVSRAVTVAEQDIAAVRAAALAYAYQLYVQAVTAAAAAVSQAEQAIATDIVALDTTLSAELSNLAGTVAADLATAEHYAASLFATAEQDIAAGVATAEQLAFSQVQALQGVVYTDLETWGTQAIADAWPDAQGDINALRGTLGADFPWLNDLLGALGGLGAAGLLGALIRALAGAHAITRLANDCIVPTCRNLSGLGQDLSQLESAAMDAALIGYLVAAITAPVATAADTYAVTGALIADTVHGLEQLLGVNAA